MNYDHGDARHGSQRDDRGDSVAASTICSALRREGFLVEDRVADNERFLDFASVKSPRNERAETPSATTVGVFMRRWRWPPAWLLGMTDGWNIR
jgi:hypothetical protein